MRHAVCCLAPFRTISGCLASIRDCSHYAPGDGTGRATPDVAITFERSYCGGPFSMSKKPSSRAASSRQEKKSQFSRPRAKKSYRKNATILAALVAIGLLSYFLGRGLTDQPETPAITVSASTSGDAGNSDAPGSGAISIPVSDLGSGQAKYFHYVAPDKTAMRFFVIKSSDGVYRAALDACDVCYRHKKGYQHMGDDMVCRKCGQRFPSKLVNEVTGGCNPVALTRTVAGGNLLIKAADLENLKTYFF